jgi:hypothetical protein
MNRHEGVLQGYEDLEQLSQPRLTLSEVELVEISICARNGKDPEAKIDYLARIA